MNNNFNVSGFANLQSKSRGIFQETISNLKNIQNICNEISNIVASEDSGIAGSWSNMADILNGPINSSNEIFDGVNNSMSIYAADVIANEEKEMKNIEKYSSSITALTNAAASLSQAINGGKTSGANLNDRPQSLSEGIFPTRNMNGDYTDSDGTHHHNNLDGTWTHTDANGNSYTTHGETATEDIMHNFQNPTKMSDFFESQPKRTMNGDYMDSNGTYHQNNLDGTYTQTDANGNSYRTYGDTGMRVNNTDMNTMGKDNNTRN